MGNRAVITTEGFLYAIGLAWLCVLCMACYVVLLPWARRRLPSHARKITFAAEKPSR
jgi:hypothetical protein